MTYAPAHSVADLAAEPISGLKGGSAFLLIAAVVVVIAIIAVIPMIMDVRRATAWRQQLTDKLIDQAATDSEVRDFLRDLREPRGVRGLTRSIIAVLILTLVGFALAVAMLSSGADSGDLRKTIVTSLMTVLATVAGFYFASLGAQNSADDARRHAASRSSATVTTGVGPTATSPADGSQTDGPGAGATAGAAADTGEDPGAQAAVGVTVEEPALGTGNPAAGPVPDAGPGNPAAESVPDPGAGKPGARPKHDPGHRKPAGEPEPDPDPGNPAGGPGAEPTK
jgi:succinate dehydrogenase hydrophobic anchor subunit